MENHTTSEALARMINEGLTASKEDVKALEDRVTTRLNRIETLLMEEQKRKIEHLETRPIPFAASLLVFTSPSPAPAAPFSLTRALASSTLALTHPFRSCLTTVPHAAHEKEPADVDFSPFP